LLDFSRHITLSFLATFPRQTTQTRRPEVNLLASTLEECMSPILIAALFIACAEPAHPIRTAGVDPSTTSCPEGSVEASDSSLFIDYMVLNWVNLYPEFTETATYNGSPATCIQTDTMGIQQIFEINGQPFGSLTIAANETGSIDLTAFTGQFRVDLHGASEPVVFESTDIDSGTLFINQSPNAFEAEASFEAYTNNQQLSIHLFSNGTSPL
jgi:hypothetical protein